MARSPITGLVELFKTLTSEQQAVFLDLVDPQVEPEQPAKKTRKKRSTKSGRASGMAAAIKNSLEQGKQAAASPSPTNGQLCTAKIPGLGVECGDPELSRVHDKNAGYAGYHPFDTSAPAQSAEKKSRRKAAGANITPNLEIEKADAMAAGN